MKVVTGKIPFFVIGPFCTHHSICLLMWQSCMEMMHFQSQCFQAKNNTLIFWKMFSFSGKSASKLKYWIRSKFQLIVTKKHADLSSGGLLWKPLVPLCRRTYALSVGFKMKPLRKSVFQWRQKPTQILRWNLSNWWITFFKYTWWWNV